MIFFISNEDNIFECFKSESISNGNIFAKVFKTRIRILKCYKRISIRMLYKCYTLASFAAPPPPSRTSSSRSLIYCPLDNVSCEEFFRYQFIRFFFFVFSHSPPTSAILITKIYLTGAALFMNEQISRSGRVKLRIIITLPRLSNAELNNKFGGAKKIIYSGRILSPGTGRIS